MSLNTSLRFFAFISLIVTGNAQAMDRWDEWGFNYLEKRGGGKGGRAAKLAVAKTKSAANAEKVALEKEKLALAKNQSAVSTQSTKKSEKKERKQPVSQATPNKIVSVAAAKDLLSPKIAADPLSPKVRIFSAGGMDITDI